MMPRFLRLAACALTLLAAALLRATPAPAFAHESSDLKPDPALTFGKLENGMRYIILPNAEPRNRVSVRLIIEAGAFMEKESQRGLAHFLEHMAFKGSPNFPPGTIIEFFQRMGMGFGNDTNAYTGFDQTVYMLELPNGQDATLAEGFRVFADYAGGLLLLPDQIEPERGVIEAEERTRDTVGFRELVAQLGFLYPETLLPQRLPIGLMEVVKTAPREEFVDFYNTWYRPELMTVLVVGDVTADKVEPMLKEALSGVTARAPARPLPDRGRIVPFTGLRTMYRHDAEAPATSVAITATVPYERPPDTAAERLRSLPRNLANAIINRRLSTLAREEKAPFSSGRTGVSDGYNLFRTAEIELTAKPGQWSAALAVAEQELRRALEHGFQESELREMTANFRNSLEQSVRTAATRPSGGLATGLISSVVNRTVFTHPTDNLALLGPALDKVTPADCLAALREVWNVPGRSVIVSGNTQIEGNAEATITAAYEASAAKPVAAPAAIADAKFAYTDFGPAGQVVHREHIADLDITLVRFANGVRLNLKPTAFEAGRIRLSARIGSGKLIEPKTQPGLAWLASNTFTAGGLGKHSSDELRRLLAGRTVGVGFGVGIDAFTLSGQTNRDDLLLQLQLMTAQLTDPGYRPEALRFARQGIDQLYRSFAHTPSGPLSTEVQSLLASGDHRFGMPPQEALMALTLDDVRQWLTPELTAGALELAVVGDFDVEAVIAAVAQTFGTLPPRHERPALDDLRNVHVPAEPFDRTFTIVTEIPKGQVVLYWPTTDGRDVRTARRLNVLGSILSDRLRLKIRNELGGAYSPGAGSSTSEVFPGYGLMYATVTVEPAAAETIREAVVAIGNDLQQQGVTADELERALKPILTGTRDSLRDNGYWLGSVLSRAQEKPEVLDWSRTRLADLESIKPDEISALAREYLAAGRVFRVTVLPAQK